MNVLIRTSLLLLVMVPASFSQDPISITKARWQRVTIPAPKPEIVPVGPGTPVMPETKNFQRNARAQRTDNPMDPNDASIEGRSRAMDKAVRESRAPQPDDVSGYLYTADIKNETGSTVVVIFWEYRFTEIAQPSNVVRRQFLCAMKMKHGQKKEVSAFSLLGPSDVIGVESLSKPSTRLFNEEVQLNRMEFEDGQVFQRNGWKYAEVEAAVKRETSKPWGLDTCRVL
jgi:hypothetical protein